MVHWFWRDDNFKTDASRLFPMSPSISATMESAFARHTQSGDSVIPVVYAAGGNMYEANFTLMIQVRWMTWKALMLPRGRGSGRLLSVRDESKLNSFMLVLSCCRAAQCAVRVTRPTSVGSRRGVTVLPVACYCSSRPLFYSLFPVSNRSLSSSASQLTLFPREVDMFSFCFPTASPLLFDKRLPFFINPFSSGISLGRHWMFDW